MNLIVRMPNWIGDLVMATPVLADLREAFPKASITAMCKSPFSDLLKTDPAIDELFTFTKPPNEFLRRQEKRDIIEKIRRGKYDVGILLTNSFSSAWLFWKGDVARRIGYRKHFRSLLLTDRISFPTKKMHHVDLYKHLLGALHVPHSKTAPRLFVSREEVEKSKELLYQRGYKKGKKLVGIHPGASYGSAKCWPTELYQQLANKLLEDPELYLVFFGDHTQVEMIQHIVETLPSRAINIASVTSIRELACLIKDVSLLIASDSGPMHIAAAFQTPLIALFGSTDEKITGPYGQNQAVIRKQVFCSPCFRRVCPIDFRCMKGITVEEVLKKAKQMLYA